MELIIFLILIIGFFYGCFKFIKDRTRKEPLQTKEEADAIIAKANAEYTRITDEAQTEYARIIQEAQDDLNAIKETIASEEVHLDELEEQIDSLEAIIIIHDTGIEDDETLSSITSEECKNKLAILKNSEKDLITAGDALIITSLDSKKMLNNNVKQIIRCFSVECDNHINNISNKNIDSVRSKIQKSFITLNKIFETDGVKLSNEFLEIKLNEAILAHSYEKKKEEGKEQQKAIKEQMLEEEKVRREIEREKQKIEKEESQFNNEIKKLMGYINKSSDSVQTQLYVDKIKELENKLKLLEEDKKNVFDREQNTRAGFVYVISNIGSFGEDVYKIGMTRRLEPMDRIKELSSASVPFEFDVHAMIFSEDAPSLETTLHQTFRNNEVNKVNHRKEFFKVSLNDIKEVVTKNHNATVQFTLLAKAKEYYESLSMK